MALLITSLGAVTTARVLSAIALQQRAHQQELAVASALYDAMETGGSAFAVGEDSGQRILLEDGTPVLFERTNHHWPEQGDPRGGQHRYLTARWTDPWGLRQERTLRTYWWPAPRIY